MTVVRAAALGVCIPLLLHCRNATEITTELQTDVPCANVAGASVSAYATGESAPPPVGVTNACDPATGKIGTFVFTPGKSDRAVIIQTVVSIAGADVGSCHEGDPHCIYQRRSIDFVPHSNLHLPIQSPQVCAGIVCDSDLTCSVPSGGGPATCVPYAVTCDGSDPPDCTLTYKPHSDGGAPDATAPIDSGTDAGVTDAGADASDGGGPLFVDCSEPDSGLVAHYKFDEGSGGATYDCANGGWTGILSAGDGGTPPTWVPGRHGTALNFDASARQYVALGMPVKLADNGDTTFSAWVNIPTPSSSSVQTIFGQNSGGFYQRYWTVAIQNGSVLFYGAQSAPLTPATWMNVTTVFTVNPKMAYIYLNGGMVQSTSVSGLTNEGAPSVSYFGAGTGITNFLTGAIDEVRVYSRALSAAEVAAIAAQ